MKIAQLELPKKNGEPFTVPEPIGFGTGEGGALEDVGSLISALLPYALILGGLVLFGMLILGGFELLTAGGSQEKTAAAAERIKNALIGFLLLFGVYWLAQIFQILFKIQIL